MNWRDVSSHSQLAEDRKPRTFECTAGWLRIMVTRHLDYPGKWVLRAYGVGIDLHPLKSTEIEGAQREALEIVLSRLTAASSAIEDGS